MLHPYAKRSSITGRVFKDRDGDGVQDANEHGLSDRVVFLDVNGDVVLNNPEGPGVASALAREPWVLTDNQGNYVLANVGPGTHRVRQVVPAGWVRTTLNPAPIEARSGRNVSGVVFGNLRSEEAAALGIEADLALLLASEDARRERRPG